MEKERKKWNICKGCGTSIQFGEYCVECLFKDTDKFPPTIYPPGLKPDRDYNLHQSKILSEIDESLMEELKKLFKVGENVQKLLIKILN